MFCFFCSIQDEATHHKDLMFFFDLKVNLDLVSIKNNLRIILGTKSKIFKNIKDRQKIKYSYKKVCRAIISRALAREEIAVV